MSNKQLRAPYPVGFLSGEELVFQLGGEMVEVVVGVCFLKV